MSAAWLKLWVAAADHAVPRLEDALLAQGALSVSVAARDDTTPRYASPGEPEPALWANCEVEALFAADTDALAVLAALAAEGHAVAGAQHTILADQDWQAHFRQQFVPRRFAGDLWVVPSWQTPPAQARHVITLDPGMAFGTGTHPTTGLCLDWLGALATLPGARVLDYGCGSGILAIAAVRLGAARVVGLDIDADACAVARTNAQSNACEGLDIVLPDALTDTQFEVLVANILLNPLLLLAARFASLLVANGRLGLSGLLTEQVSAVQAVYGAWFELDPPCYREEWAFVSGRRRGATAHA
ncbi:MAG: 50S ribosomal protein L11 methyltransferase [Gammaproteobacteria bacterium]|nr:50S ribosomal protein L11 methyltransferase [Gammaproteobacteria bacterium]